MNLSSPSPAASRSTATSNSTTVAPDAALLNEALTAMGRQGPQPARITEDTYEALNNLLDSLGYAHVKTDQPIPSRYFLIVNRAGLSPATPRNRRHRRRSRSHHRRR